MVAQLVQRHLVHRHDELTIARLAWLERGPFFQIVEVSGRNDVESDEVNRGQFHWLAFDDRHRDVDGILLVVELDVEGGDARIGIASVGIKRLDALEICVES